MFVMVDFICIDLVELQHEAIEFYKIKNACHQLDLNPQS